MMVKQRYALVLAATALLFVSGIVNCINPDHRLRGRVSVSLPTEHLWDAMSDQADYSVPHNEISRDVMYEFCPVCTVRRSLRCTNLYAVGNQNVQV